MKNSHTESLQDPLTTLTSDALSYVLSFCDYHTWRQAAQVCVEWRKAVNMTWKQKIRTTFPDVPYPRDANNYFHLFLQLKRTEARSTLDGACPTSLLSLTVPHPALIGLVFATKQELELIETCLYASYASNTAITTQLFAWLFSHLDTTSEAKVLTLIELIIAKGTPLDDLDDRWPRAFSFYARPQTALHIYQRLCCYGYDITHPHIEQWLINNLPKATVAHYFKQRRWNEPQKLTAILDSNRQDRVELLDLVRLNPELITQFTPQSNSPLFKTLCSNKLDVFQALLSKTPPKYLTQTNRQNLSVYDIALTGENTNPVHTALLLLRAGGNPDLLLAKLKKCDPEYVPHFAPLFDFFQQKPQQMALSRLMKKAIQINCLETVRALIGLGSCVLAVHGDIHSTIADYALLCGHTRLCTELLPVITRQYFPKLFEAPQTPSDDECIKLLSQYTQQNGLNQPWAYINLFQDTASRALFLNRQDILTNCLTTLDLNATTPNTLNLLQTACLLGRYQTARALLERGANINILTTFDPNQPLINGLNLAMLCAIGLGKFAMHAEDYEQCIRFWNELTRRGLNPQDTVPHKKSQLNLRDIFKLYSHNEPCVELWLDEHVPTSASKQSVPTDQFHPDRANQLRVG